MLLQKEQIGSGSYISQIEIVDDLVHFLLEL